MLKKLAVGIAVGLAATSAQASDWLHCGDVFDSQSGQLVGERYIEVENGDIKSVKATSGEAPV